MYKYETHLHTREASACAATSGAQYPAYYQSLGYSGIFITDHFFNGNCRVPEYDDWERRVREFCLGYETAKAAGDAIGFPVFFGWEANFDGDEYLIYGLSKEWLLSHPDLLQWNRTRQYDEVRAAGGLVVQAHPFRERSYLTAVYLNPETCDAMEAYNACNENYQNQNAELYCKKQGIFMTAGSDLHKIGSLDPSGLYGMEFEKPLSSSADYVKAVLSKKGRIAVPDTSRPADADATLRTKLPVVIHRRE